MAGELTEAEREARRGGLGGSDAGPVFGYGYGTPYTVWADKVYGTTSTVTAAMQRGHDLEHVVAAKFEERTGVLVEPCAGQIWHPEIPWLFASMDYRGTALLSGTRVECKTAMHRDTGDQWGPDGSGPDGLPPHYLLQARHQLAADVDALRVFVVVLFVDIWEIRLYEVERDQAFQDLMLEGEQRFWDEYVVARVPPPIGRPDRDLEAARQIPGGAGEVRLGAGARGWLVQWASANRASTEAKRRREEAQAELARLIGEGDTATLNGVDAVTVSYNQHGTRSYRLASKRKWED